MNKKVLIIAYYWPPAGGPGVQRWLKFIKYLPDFKITPIVYVPENATYPVLDESLKTEIPSTVKIIKQPIHEPYKLAKLFSKKTKTYSKGLISEVENQTVIEKALLFIRGNFFIPDARKNWVKPSVKYLSKVIKEEAIDTVITTGPPHSLHLIGKQLKEKLSVKWIVDFRDPWTQIDYHKQLKLTTWAAKKHKQLERDVLCAADQLIVTSQTTKNEFSQLTSKPIEVITNGFDVEKVKKVPLDDKFTCSHIGSLSTNRNPEVLWQVFSELLEETPNFSEYFQLNLIGSVSTKIMQSLKKLKLERYANVVEYVSHTEAVKYQRASQVLLLLEANELEKKGIIPGKLFEYMASNRPILAIGPAEWEVANILKNTNTGSAFLYTEKQLIKETLLGYYKDYEQHTLQSFAVGINQYSRKELTKKLTTLF